MHACLSFESSSSHTHNPTSCSAVMFALREVSSVRGTKQTLSIYLHPLCLCLSPRQQALTGVWPIVSVSQPRLLSLSKTMILAV